MGVESKWAVQMATEPDARDECLMLSQQLENLKLVWTKIVIYWNWTGLARRIRASYMFNSTNTAFIQVARYQMLAWTILSHKVNCVLMEK